MTWWTGKIPGRGALPNYPSLLVLFGPNAPISVAGPGKTSLVYSMCSMESPHGFGGKMLPEAPHVVVLPTSASEQVPNHTIRGPILALKISVAFPNSSTAFSGAPNVYKDGSSNER